MSQINVIRRDGQKSSVVAIEGQSVMHALRENGIDDLLALCGGSCACATCHVFVDEAWAARLPAPGETELALVESSEAQAPNSRLACQIKVSDDLNGMTITIAPEE